MVDRRAWWLAAAVALASMDCAPGERCAPGQSRACTRTLDGGVTQSGFESCEASGQWSACVSVGGCSSTEGALPIYSRCEETAQCGPAGCATCTNYVGVDNPGGYSVCFVYCQADSDCAPTTASSGVAPRCLLGQCALLCRSGSTCPRDSQCLGWANDALAAAYPGYDGLCE